MSVADRRQLIERNHGSLSINRQCGLVGLNRSSYYYEPQGESEETFALMREIDRIYTDHPCYGSRRIVAVLRRQGIAVDRDRVVRLMRLMGIEGKLPGQRTTRPAPGHKVHPNLLRGRTVERPGEAWASDITYLPMPKGTMYLTVVMDWYSRYVVAWELSNSLDCDFCVRALESALEGAEAPDLFHGDQGCQYTARGFTVVLEGHNVAISMSGRGRAYDNILVERFWRSLKYDEIYSRAAGETARRRRERSGNHEYGSVDELRRAVAEYIHHYNTERPHQALDYHAPWEIYMNRLDAAESKGNTGIQTWGSQEPLSAPPTN